MRIAACLVVKNEALGIAEWLAFHAVAGVDTFLVYDNGSTDGTRDVLAAAARVLDVRVTSWTPSAGTAQMEAYRHAFATAGTEFDWIAVLDSDEYLVVHSPHSLRGICGGLPDADLIALNWAVFGSAGHVAVPAGLTIEAFTRRAPPGFDKNRTTKCLVRPRGLLSCINPHAFSVRGRAVSPIGSPVAWHPVAWHIEGGKAQPGRIATAPDYAVAQVNHYFTRSRAHWVLKNRRGYPDPQSLRKLSCFDEYDRNEVQDRSALRHLAAVRALKARLSRPAAPSPLWNPSILSHAPERLLAET